MAALAQWEDLITGPQLEGHIADILSILFEPTNILITHVGPAIATQLSDPAFTQHPKSYQDLIDLSASHIEKLHPRDRSEFIRGHPRIGEVSNLSALSAAEQASKKTPPEVLKQLERLNVIYEWSYPRLRYVTFVNGRSRAEIVPEMKKLLGITGDLDDVTQESTVVWNEGSKEWLTELNRSVHATILIAKARLDALGVI
ncbi:Oxo-4-hydroxy-4-carboxy-5-ureidoimidazoline decarboxylase [Cantharellus anzutake]|uniref:Oxo-4-hydroxy-4-carboxy-5-ureidoimidazoline decarboxylase n=1 Tax=Cantharellus anzutake TaxID=1750568 RepID=UPI001907B0A6|nr:Oxo-4-hydroxy-4-carboxy-5-ureidoimidazoline decarboxylase [Cantharellus anzutake]KAF8325877.1 Oxo-4-hydroxy-4-carboxy-5-ureidoimidazoline decarboxylase [Cantharellus anzutake]